MIEPFKDRNLKLVRLISRIIKSPSYWKTKKKVTELVTDPLIKMKPRGNAFCQVKFKASPMKFFLKQYFSKIVSIQGYGRV